MTRVREMSFSYEYKLNNTVEKLNFQKEVCKEIVNISDFSTISNFVFFSL